jgi:hypothetical protein
MSNEYVLVTTLSHFKLKYAIPRDAYDKLNLGDPIDREQLLQVVGSVKEFSQAHLGEVVADVVIYDETDILSIFDTDNDYLASWTQEQKIAWINRWQEEPV